jgi:hypothetical protein
MTDQPRADTSAPQPSAQGSADKSKLQPTKKLPTNRINFTKQLEVLRAYGTESMGGTRPANAETVAKLTQMVVTTLNLTNTFFVENGFIERNGNSVAPSRPVVEFAQAYQWQPETAARKLAPLIRRSWFGARLLSLVSFRPTPIEAALQELAQEAQAGPDYKAQIELLIDFAAASGVVRRDGNQLALGDGSDAPEQAPQERSAPEPAPPARDEGARPSASPAAVSTGFLTTEGGVQFHVGIRVTMEEMAGWAPDRITAFFAGLAQVLAAKKGAETIR